MAQTLIGGIVGLTAMSASLSLRVATGVFMAASDTVIVDALLQIIHRTVEALTDSLTGAALVWRGIFTNGTNKASVTFILNNLNALFGFLYDLFKPDNIIPRFPNAMTGASTNGTTGLENPYNELDLRKEENRRAIVYQIQRVALTLVQILKVGKDNASHNDLSKLNINARLRSDFDAKGNPPPATYDSPLAREQGPSRPDEKWLFINGIANEFVWFQRSCDKIRDTFLRDVRGVYNRSDGILWDLIECCGERSTADLDTNNALIARTESSRAAQNILVKELSDALWPKSGRAPKKVVMIAHSQGVLILRLALQRLVNDHPKGSQRRMEMKERLMVFTFGSPSVDWRATDEPVSLSEFTKVTEHFAHKADFVAMLGVVSHRDDPDSGYDGDCVFYSNGGRGHLLGAHYCLGAEAYGNGAKSRLLAAVNGGELVL